MPNSTKLIELSSPEERLRDLTAELDRAIERARHAKHVLKEAKATVKQAKKERRRARQALATALESMEGTPAVVAKKTTVKPLKNSEQLEQKPRRVADSPERSRVPRTRKRVKDAAPSAAPGADAPSRTHMIAPLPEVAQAPAGKGSHPAAEPGED